MRKRWMVWRLMAVALASLALTGGLAARAAAQDTPRPWLGVSTQEITSDLREGLNYKGAGVLVSRVVSDSPASRAGIKNGDVLVSFNSRTIDTPDELTEVVQAAKVGQSVALSIVHEGVKRSVTAKLAEWPSDESDLNDMPTPAVPRSPRAPRAPRAYTFNWNGDDLDVGPGMGMLRNTGRGRLGVQIQNLNSDLGDALGVPGGKGVLVTDVVDDTPASKVGIKGGDVIVDVGGTKVEDTDDLRRELGKREGKVPITLMRRGAKRTVTPELEAKPNWSWYNDGNRRHTITIAPDVRIDPEDDSNHADLEKQMEQLRQELKEMRQQMEESKAPAKAPAKKKS
jgi:predicted metalloprotease with PDZ domain